MGKKISRFTLFIMLMILTFISVGAIYMKKDQHGHVTYSDTQFPNSQQVEISDSGSTISTKTQTETHDLESTTTTPTGETGNKQPVMSGGGAAATNEEIPKVRENYVVFYILSPKDQATIQNQVSIPVDIVIKPNLMSGDKIQLLLDGKSWGEPVANTNLQLNNVERGTHQLAAAIVDANNNIVTQSSSITLYVHRASAAGPTRTKPPAPPPLTVVTKPAQ